MGEWLRNDDNLSHIAHVDGEYKVNMIFYRAMINAPEAVFYVGNQWTDRMEKIRSN